MEGIAIGIVSIVLILTIGLVFLLSALDDINDSLNEINHTLREIFEKDDE